MSTWSKSFTNKSEFDSRSTTDTENRSPSEDGQYRYLCSIIPSLLASGLFGPPEADYAIVLSGIDHTEKKSAGMYISQK